MLVAITFLITLTLATRTDAFFGGQPKRPLQNPVWARTQGTRSESNETFTYYDTQLNSKLRGSWWKIVSDSSLCDLGAKVNIESDSVRILQDNKSSVIPFQTIKNLAPIRAKVYPTNKMRVHFVIDKTQLVTDLPGLSLRVRGLSPRREFLRVNFSFSGDCVIVASVWSTETPEIKRELILLKETSDNSSGQSPITPVQFFLMVVALHVADKFADFVLDNLSLLVQSGFSHL